MDGGALPPPGAQLRTRRLTLEGGYDAELVDKQPLSGMVVECPICKLILRDPYLISCGCKDSFCKTCIEPVYNRGNPCPLCNSIKFTICPNTEKKLILENSKVYCSNKKKGCNWIGDLKDLDSHLKSDSKTGCSYVELTCALCTDKVLKSLMAIHRESVCRKRQYLCQSCSNYQSDYEDVMENHMPNCELVLMDCPNEGCVSKPMPKKDIKQHLLECPESVVQCKLASAGCHIRFQRKEADKHYQTSVDFHMNLLIDRDDSDRKVLNNQVKTLETENKAMREDVKMLKEAVDFLRSEKYQEQNEGNNTIKELKIEIGALQNEVKMLKQQLAGKEEANLHMLRRVDGMSDELDSIQSTVRRNVRLIQQVYSQHAAEQPGHPLQMEDMQREFQQLCNPLSYQVDQNSQDIKSVAEEGLRTSGRLSSLEDEVERVSIKAHSSFERVNMRFEEVEDQAAVTLVSQLGKQPILVTLRDFARWQVENKEWNSPSFYLAGYKMCLTAYVNGDPKMDSEGFFSLYVHLMKGENDHTLNWPFQQSVVLEVLHLTDEKKNVKQVLRFKNDMDRKYNGRVKERRAKGWGYAKFMPHEMLNEFLRGPREFLDIRVSLK